MNLSFAENAERDNPVLILTISNGAGHIRVAQGIAAAIREVEPSMPLMIADVADYMKAFVRFTHVTAYLWILKHAPSAWDRIDRYQKQQPHTSPEWFYRRGCQPLFELASRVRPRAIVATEVGCCEIAALMKRDLGLTAPLIAVNDDYDADRAWVQPEVDLYCFITSQLGEELISQGAPPERIAIWGAPLSIGYGVGRRREDERAEVCRWLNLDPDLPLVLIAGGGEGMGQIEETTARLLQLQSPALQLVVLTGRNERLKSRCESLSQKGSGGTWRVLGWTEPERMAKLMCAADLMVSKLGSMFNEAIASELPIVALEPPPGAERVQYRLLEDWKVGCAVRTLNEVTEVVQRLLSQPQLLAEMRAQSRAHYRSGVSQRIARWLVETTSGGRAANGSYQTVRDSGPVKVSQHWSAGIAVEHRTSARETGG
jgi:processive 1,2-diacylglycerol beta-glucosyltransferase